MKLKYILIVLLCATLFFAQVLFAQNSRQPETGATQKKLTLDRAVMCEEITDFAPHNPAVVFSIKIGKVFCYTSFDPVPEKTFIYHKWFHRDSPSTNKRLILQPPRWATYSTIQLRETDKGPWRIEISDQNGKLLSILRFSITD
ncbi:MAG: DUF2914 domain-containing protein [Desulfobacterales bacterium]